MTLYHYCSADTLLKILQSRTLWASSLSAANDWMEGKWLLEVFEKRLIQVGAAPERAAVIRRLYETGASNYEALAICFSERGDVLSQWRGYADDGQGFAIGFREGFVQAVVDPNTGQGSPFYYAKIDYETEDQLKRIPETIDFALSMSKRDLHPSEVEIPWSDLSEEFQTALFSCKNPAFDEEREHRIFLPINMHPDATPHLPTGISFRASGSNLAPYFSVPFPSGLANPIEEIVVGPRNPTSDLHIKWALDSCGYTNVKISASSASYHGSVPRPTARRSFAIKDAPLYIPHRSAIILEKLQSWFSEAAGMGLTFEEAQNYVADKVYAHRDPTLKGLMIRDYPVTEGIPGATYFKYGLDEPASYMGGVYPHGFMPEKPS